MRAATIQIKKATITIHSRGCVDCGTEFSSGWTAARTIVVIAGRRTLRIPVHRCDDCQAKRKRR